MFRQTLNVEFEVPKCSRIVNYKIDDSRFASRKHLALDLKLSRWKHAILQDGELGSPKQTQACVDMRKYIVT